MVQFSPSRFFRLVFKIRLVRHERSSKSNLPESTVQDGTAGWLADYIPVTVTLATPVDGCCSDWPLRRREPSWPSTGADDTAADRRDIRTTADRQQRHMATLTDNQGKDDAVNNVIIAYRQSFGSLANLRPVTTASDELICLFDNLWSGNSGNDDVRHSTCNPTMKIYAFYLTQVWQLIHRQLHAVMFVRSSFETSKPTT